MNPEVFPKSKILIVDDNANNLKVLSGTLDNHNWDILVAVDGESAIEQAAYIRPDLIFLDVMMPIMDGFSAGSSGFEGINV